MTSEPYPTDLTDEEWQLISGMFVTVLSDLRAGSVRSRAKMHENHNK
jgi:hypothetical protein